MTMTNNEGIRKMPKKVAKSMPPTTATPILFRAAAPAPVAAPAPAPAAAAPSAPAAKAAATPSNQPKAPHGYKLQQRDGQTYYCKRAKVLGSNIERTVCMTPEEYKQSEAAAAEQREDMRRRANMCNAPGGACGG